HRGHRNVVERARGESGEPGGHALVGGRTWGRGCELRERSSRTRGGGCSVIDAVGRQVCQWASVGIRRWGSPGSVEDPGASRWRCQEDSAEDEAESDAIDGGPTLREHVDLVLSGRPPMFPGVSSTPTSATRLSGSSPDPWFCVAASRRVYPSRQGAFPVRLVCSHRGPSHKPIIV